jgi:hypothetical protein
MMRLAFALALFAAAGPARASVVVPLDLSALCEKAGLIVHGEVLKQESVWEKGRIVTRSVVKVLGALKGSADREVVVRHMGGVVHGIGQKVYGETTLGVGEEVVLFLRPMGGEYRTVGMAQGKFKVVVDPRSGARRAVQELAGLEFLRVGGATWPTPARSADLPLADFFSRVTAEIARLRESSAKP